MQFKHAIIGGTFDHFHVGHKAMLEKAFNTAEKVSIGITTPEMYQNKALNSQIESQEVREQALKNFLEKDNWLSRAIIIPISNKYGNTLTDPTIEAIIVSPETEKVAQEIQSERVQKGLSKLEIIVVPFVMSEDGKIVSSERIRKGEIDRNGSSYSTFLKERASLHLPDSLRSELQKPIGRIVTNVEDVQQLVKPNSFLISIGDIVTTDLMQHDIFPTISIVDLRTRRQDLDPELIEKFFSNVAISLNNPAGTISPDFAELFLEKLQSNPEREIIRVDGEEDLLTMPAILLSPLGTTVIYGQFEVGMVVVEVTEEVKDMIQHLIEQFS